MFTPYWKGRIAEAGVMLVGVVGGVVDAALFVLAAKAEV